MPRYLAALCLLALANPLLAAEPIFSQATDEAWAAAGARASVLLIENHVYASTSPYLEMEGHSGHGFYLGRWGPGKLRDLPPPEKPFFLYIDWGGTTDETFAELKKYKNLTTLVAYGDKVTDAGVAELAGLEKLQRLHLGGTGSPLTDEALAQIAKLPALEALSLTGTEHVTAAGVAHLLKIKTLRALDLSENKLGLEAIKLLAKHENLQYVRISRSALRPEQYDVYQSFPALEGLYISNSWTDDTAVQHVAKMERLKELDCSLAPVHDKSIKALAAMPNLEKLLIWNTPITDEGVALFQTFPKLSYVAISGPQLTDKSLVELAKVKTLKYVRITATSMTDEGLRKFFEDRPDVKGSVNLFR